MGLQTTFTTDPAAAIAGMLADVSYTVDVISRALETVAGVDSGFAVRDGATIGNGGTCKVLSATGDTAVFLGITVLDLYREPKSPRFAQFDAVPILRKGRIWVTSVDDTRTIVGSNVYLYYTGGNVGLFGGNPNASANLITNASWVMGANTGLLALLEINFPQ